MKKITKYIAVAALFLVPIFPLIVANSFFFPFITGKAFYFRILIELAFASWIILAFLDAKFRPKLTALTVGISLFALIALVADLLGVNPLRSLWSNFERMEGWITILHLWAFYIVATSIFGSGEEGKHLWHRWLNTSLAVAFIVALYGLFQLFGWAQVHQGSTRLDASLGNSAYMAVYMLFHAFIAAYFFFVARMKRAKNMANAAVHQWVYGIVSVLFAFIIFETQTRGTILGLIGGIMLALALYAIFGKGEPKKWRWISAGFIGSIILLGIIFWFNRTNPIIERNPVLGRFSHISWTDSSNQARQYIWPMALKGAMERPVLGWGQENFNYIFNAGYNPAMYAQEQWFDRAHNVFIDWLVASGIVGVIAYLALYVLFLIAVWKSSLTVAEKSVLTGLLAGYFVHNVFVFDNLASYALFFGMLGFVNSLKEGKHIRLLGTEPARVDGVEYVVAPVVIVALVFVLYFFDVRVIRANTSLIAALRACGSPQASPSLFEKTLGVDAYVANQEIREQLLSCAGNVIASQTIPGPTKQAFFGLATREIQAQIAATPNDARIYVLGGSFLNGIGQYEQAEGLLETGHQLTPKKQSLDFELANDYLNTGKKEKAVELLKQAYESAPDFPQAKSAYAITLIVSGREAEARTIFKNDPEVFNTAQMAQVYASLKQYSKAVAIYEEMVKKDPANIEIRAQLAQMQYTAGMVSQAIQTLRDIEKTNPELKDKIEAAIKQVQK